MNIIELKERYENNAAFNKLVNMFRRGIEDFGFLPSEMREAAFYAQYTLELFKADHIFRSLKEWEQLAEAREILQKSILDIDSLLKESK